MLTSTVADIMKGFAQWPLWGRLGWMDIRRRYKRTVLGPLWATLSMAIFIGALGILWAKLWNVETSLYLPFLTAGFLTWALITTILIESCMVLVNAESIIMQVPLPYTVHLLTVIWRNVIVFGHHLIVYLGVCLLYPPTITLSMLLFVPGLLIVIINSLWMALILSIICTRYRDIPTLVASILQIMMFITPIMWSPGTLGGKKAMIVGLNPAYHLVEVVRAPMLGHAPTPENWFVVIAMAIIGWIVAILMFHRYRRWIPYWF